MANTGHSATNQNFSSRPRFCSAPSPSILGPWPPALPNSFWSRVDEVAKSLHEKIKFVISDYAPSRWQPLVLQRVDTIAQRLQTTFDQEARSRISDFWSSNITSTENYSFALRFLIVAGVTTSAILIFLLLSTILTALALGFFLPFYAVFVSAFSYATWRRHLAQTGDHPSARLLNYWWCGVAVMDLLITLIAEMAGSSENRVDGNWLLKTTLHVHHALPLLAFGGAKLFLDISRKDGTLGSSHPWLLEYFLLTYAARCFSVRGFLLFPECLRAFFGYAACYLATTACHKTLSKLSGGSDPGGANAVSSSREQCSEDGGATGSAAALSAFRPISVPQLVLPASGGAGAAVSSSRNRFHFSDSDSALRNMANAGGRGSRRVSLPAGSLLPIKSAQSSLSEARGMLADMLAQKDLPPHLVAGLKAVSSLLVPGSSQAVQAALQLDFLGTLPRVFDSPYIGGDVSLASVESAAQRRHSPSVVFSTTTSATGLPTLEPEPSRARSSSYWKHKLSDGEHDDGKALFKQSVDLPSKLVQLSDGIIYDLAEIARDQYLDRLKEWGLPIFDMYAETPDTILSRTAFTVFQRSGLFRIFKINKHKFLSFFHSLEKGYWNIPYHSRVHATDVLQATYYFTSHKVPAFNGAVRCNHRLSSIGEQQEDAEDVSGRETDDDDSSANSKSSAQLDDPNGTLASVLSSLELMGLFTAAAMHDFDHPGRTNAFLVAIQDKKATLYNDRSVLENHHAAAAWQLLTRPENNFVEQLDPAEFKRFRYTIIEAILATDLKRHFEILMDFNGKVAKGLDWENESDKLLTCQICIKMADINSPAKPGNLHKDWTDRILEEFYAQGDEEKERGLPVSPYMDRHDPQLARLQDSFIAHLVGPLALSMNDAGLLPLTVSEPSPNDPSTTIVKSELLVNLERNHKHWKLELGEDPDTSIAAVPHIVNAPSSRGNTPCSKEEEEMETIEEGEDENGS